MFQLGLGSVSFRKICEIVCDGLRPVFQPFDALDESAKLVAGDAMSIRYRVLLIGMINFGCK